MSSKSDKLKASITQERFLYGAAVVLLLVITSMFIYSLNFLNETIVPAFSTPEPDIVEEIRFNLQGFEEIEL